MEHPLLFDEVFDYNGEEPFLGLCDCAYYCSEEPNCSLRWDGRRDEAWCREVSWQEGLAAGRSVSAVS